MKVLQLIDSLAPGGAERMAVSLANGLANAGESSFLCATRAEGMLRDQLASNVKYLFLNRKNTFDLIAIKQLLNYIKSENISVIHAHGSSFFLATILKIRYSSLKLVWHEHYGNRINAGRVHNFTLKTCSRLFDSIITVSPKLHQWAVDNLHCKNVMYLRNFVVPSKIIPKEARLSFGKPSKRIICLANLRPDKDHDTLLEAFRMVQEKHNDWSLWLVGTNNKDVYGKRILQQLSTFKYDNVYFLGERDDVMNVLKHCQIGVLSSKSEGLPMALLEYGIAGLAVVATNVGDCESVVRSNGILVEPEAPALLAEGIIKLIEDETMRNAMGEKFRERILKTYTFDAIKPDLMNCYGEN